MKNQQANQTSLSEKTQGQAQNTEGRKYMKHRFPVFKMILLSLFLSAEVWSATDVSGPVILKENRLTLEAAGLPLGKILDEIRIQGGVEFVGLEDRTEEAVNFSAKAEPLEKALKRLLRTLDVSSYAFEYKRTKLKRVSVVPKSKSDVSLPRPPVPAESGQMPVVNESVVRIIRINEGTQAENLDLMENDLILEYDGVRIRNAQQLVAAVKKKLPAETVEMLVIREKEPRRIVLNGGLIGVNVVTVTVPASELGQ
ncbi:MAG: PDZ domain-containing protein [Desulfococcaceae bacterium]